MSTTSNTLMSFVGYVFGYGSLAHPDDWALHEYNPKNQEPLYGYIRDYRRTWEVAIDNTDQKYDQKHYLLDGQRARCAVATLGVYSFPGNICNGLAVPVTEEKLRLLDQREIAYKRIEISSLWQGTLDRPLWIYIPKPEMFEAYNKEPVFLPKQYWQTCYEAFSFWRGWKDFLQSTDPLLCPQKDLRLWRDPSLLMEITERS